MVRLYPAHPGYNGSNSAGLWEITKLRMELTTSRLVIRPLRKGEGAKIASYFQSNRAFLQPFYPTFKQDDFHPTTWERHIPQIHTDIEWHRAARLCIFQADELIGVANFTNIHGHPRHACTLGYSLTENAQGKGLMVEALEAAVPWVINEFRLHRIEANYMPRNERSGRVLEKIGFQKEGLAKKYLLINGVWEDHILTAFINHDF